MNFTELLLLFGDTFDRLERDVIHGEIVWRARAWRDAMPYVETADTPEFALANLWALMNKKDNERITNNK